MTSSPPSKFQRRTSEKWPKSETKRAIPFALAPQHGATGAAGDFLALLNEPWLKLDDRRTLEPGKIMQIRYSSAIFDEPVRPVLRFWLQDGGFRDLIGPAPYCGAGVWTGRIPEGLRETWISPTNRIGPFSFQIDSIARASPGALVRKAVDAPKRMFFAASASLVGLRDESDLNLRWALGHSKSEAYASWRGQRVGTLPAKPRSDWSTAPEVILILDIPVGSESLAEATYRSILAQSYANWRMVIRQASPTAPFPAFCAPDRRCGTEWPQNADRSLWGVLQAGDELDPDALACFIEYFARNPRCNIAYTDETIVSENGEERLNPKPDWSPCLEEWAPYVGRAALWRRLTAKPAGASRQTAEDAVSHVLETVEHDQVGHIRRALFRFRTPDPCKKRAAPPAVAATPRRGRVSLIIPTRDRASLLKACVGSIIASRLEPSAEILIVDNGSKEPRTEALFRELESRRPNLVVLRQPGPFNFSALCNAAAVRATGDMLVFLNNDTEVRTPDWLDKMQIFAARPDIGAVGAKLLFPNGNIQHQGVVLGVGGVAAHFGAQAPADTPGWRRTGRVPHETSAVTAACLMVEKRKFDAIGGFDAENLPVDLNDIDLCLRLAQRGWRTVCDARVELLHRESASRGAGTFRLQRVYARERAYFLQKWSAVIRDDPYFNPALSLYALDERLW